MWTFVFITQSGDFRLEIYPFRLIYRSDFTTVCVPFDRGPAQCRARDVSHTFSPSIGDGAPSSYFERTKEETIEDIPVIHPIFYLIFVAVVIEGRHLCPFSLKLLTVGCEKKLSKID